MLAVAADPDTEARDLGAADTRVRIAETIELGDQLPAVRVRQLAGLPPCVGHVPPVGQRQRPNRLSANARALPLQGVFVSVVLGLIAWARWPQTMVAAGKR